MVVKIEQVDEAVRKSAIDHYVAKCKEIHCIAFL
jgi:hypothetical protein